MWSIATESDAFLMHTLKQLQILKLQTQVLKLSMRLSKTSLTKQLLQHQLQEMTFLTYFTLGVEDFPHHL